MKGYRFTLVVMALAGLSVAREAPGPEAATGNVRVNNPVGTETGVTAQEWIDILAPVLAAARHQDEDS